MVRYYTHSEMFDMIHNNNESKTEIYNIPEVTSDNMDKITDIMDDIYPNYIQDFYEYNYNFCCIYNNIIVSVSNYLHHPVLHFYYIESLINKNDLEIIKDTFKFLLK